MPVNTKRGRNNVYVPADIRDAIGQRIREWRGDRRQEDVADDIDVSQRTWSAYERGMIPQAWEIMRRLIEAGADPVYILTGEKGNGR